VWQGAELRGSEYRMTKRGAHYMQGAGDLGVSVRDGMYVATKCVRSVDCLSACRELPVDA
jgi:hypothetical protein